MASALITVEAASGLHEIEVVLEPDRAVAGRVVDEQGRPIVGVAVEGMSTMLNRAVTDDQGEFDLGGMPPPSRPEGHHILASTDDRGLLGSAVAQPGDLDLTIVMRPR